MKAAVIDAFSGGARTPHVKRRYQIEAHIRAHGLPNGRMGEGAGGER
jgi:hypothetical protein